MIANEYWSRRGGPSAWVGVGLRGRMGRPGPVKRKGRDPKGEVEQARRGPKGKGRARTDS